jgi:uncharacterized protein YdhG (YjbR/CyaY superfamily)
MMKKVADFAEYLTYYPAPVQKMLKQLRATIKKAAPQAEEYIGYGMPGFKYHGVLVYFAAYGKHIGFYPGASGIENFKKKLTMYPVSKGTVQLPLDKPLPLELISEIVLFRVAENELKASLKEKVSRKAAR